MTPLRPAAPAGGSRPAAGRTAARGALALAAAAALAAASPAGAFPSAPGGASDVRASPDPPSREARAVLRAGAPDTLTALEGAARPRWSFPVGEESTYRVAVALGPVRAPRPVGTARLRVEARDTVGGVEVYRTSLEMEARIPMIYSLHNRQVSWIAPDPLRSLQYEERLREGDHRRHRLYRLRQEEGTYTRYDRADGGWRAVEGWEDVDMPPGALDEVAFLYLARGLPLEPGRTYRLDRHFEADGNPVILEVLRRETVRVPAGRFETVVVRPVIRSSGLFSRGGRAEVFITDDDRRLIVQIRSRMAVGRVHFLLETHRPGAAPAAAGGATASDG